MQMHNEQADKTAEIELKRSDKKTTLFSTVHWISAKRKGDVLMMVDNILMLWSNDLYTVPFYNCQCSSNEAQIQTTYFLAVVLAVKHYS